MNRLLNTSVLLASLALPGAALAEGAFIFVDVAYAKGDIENHAMIDDSGVGFLLGGGYMFSDLLSAEVGYVSYGELAIPGATVDGSGWLAGGRVQVPLSNGLGAFGRFGAHRWEITITDDPTETGTDLYFGLGGSFAFSETTDAYVAWTRYLIDHSEGGDTTYDHWGAGMLVRF